MARWGALARRLSGDAEVRVIALYIVAGLCLVLLVGGLK
jgi:hypothetical protein